MISDEDVIKIGQVIGKFAGDDQELARLLAYSVGRGLILDRSAAGKISVLLHEDMRHVRDWLKAALVNEAPWLQNVDEHGRPKKLMKLMSLKACVAEADKEMRKAATRKGPAVKLPEDEELFAELDEGFYLVRLRTQNALEREGRAMQHCIGDGAYDQSVERDDHLFLSLRGPFGQSHVTIEVVDECVSQIQGKQNKPPVGKYIEVLAPHFSSLGLEAPTETAVFFGHVIEKSGNWVAIEKMHSGIEIQGDYELSLAGVNALPSPMTVCGDLGMMKAMMEAIPDYLTVTNDADFSHSSIRYVPGNICIGGSLRLEGSRVEYLPENLSIGRDLTLQLTSITELPKGLKIGSCLSIHQTKICELPDDIEIGDAIHMDAGQIEEFPDTLSDDLTIITFVDGEMRQELLGDIRARQARPAA